MHSAMFISAQMPPINRQHGGGGVTIWASFAATGPGYLAVNESTMTSVYQSIQT